MKDIALAPAWMESVFRAIAADNPSAHHDRAKGNSMGVQSAVLDRIRGFGYSFVFTNNRFLDLGNRKAVDKALSRLVSQGKIRRVLRGIYGIPRNNPIIGIVAPGADAIVKAIAARDGIRVTVSGAKAANMLGMSTHAVAQILYYTEGPSRAYMVGKRKTRFVHRCPKMMKAAGRISGSVIHVLSYWGSSMWTTP